MTRRTPIPWDRPIPIGVSPSGVVTLAPTFHTLLGGSTGSGKSVVAHTILLGLAQREHTQFVLIDPKVVELPAWQWGDRAACVASGPKAAAQALQLLRAEMMSRYEWAEGQRVKKWPVSAEHPRLVVLLDELAEVTLSKNGGGDDLQSILAMGRAAGIMMLNATQQPDANVLETRMRNNHRQRICLGTEMAEQTKMVLGPDAGQVPCHRIPESEPGHGFLRVDRAFREFRSYLVTDDQIEAVISATAHLRRDLPGFPAHIKDPMTTVKGGKAA